MIEILRSCISVFPHWRSNGSALRRYQYQLRGIVLLIQLVCLGVGNGRIARAQIQGNTKLLATAAEAIQRNIGLIRTWSGVVEFEYADDRSETNSVLTRIEFVFDRDIPALKYRKFYGAAKTPTESGLKIRDALHTFQPPANNTSIHVLVRGVNREANGLTGETFDPFAAFDCPGMAETMAARLLFYHRYADNKRYKQYSVERSNDLVTLNIVKEGFHSWYTVDLQKSGNLIESGQIVSSPQGEFAARYTIAYIKTNGVWVPSRMIWGASDPRDKANADIVSKTILWKEIAVNENIDRDEFTLAAIGVGQGTPIHDSRNGARLYYGEQPPVLKMYGWKVLLLLLNILVVIIIAAILLCRKYKTHMA